MTLDTWLTLNEISTTEFARRIGRQPSTVHKYRLKGRIPDASTMPLIVAESGGAVQPNDFYDIPKKKSRRRKAAS